MAAPNHQHELLLQAARSAVDEFQAGRAAPSVEDILHLEKRFARLPGASGGAVALEDAAQLLAAEVLAGEPLDLVAAAVLGAGPTGASGGAPPQAVLTKRQFLSLAHVAELAQRAAFDLVTAEDALRSQELPAGKKRHPAIRDTNINTWRISARPAQGGEGEEGGEAADAPYDAAAALAAAAPGPLEAALASGGGLSRAASLTLAVGPLQQGVAALSRQNSAELGEEGGAGAGAQHRPLQHVLSGNTSYVSALEQNSDGEPSEGEEEGEGADASTEADAAVHNFHAKMDALRHQVSGGVVGAPAESCPPTPENLLPPDAAPAPVQAPVAATSAQARASWESFSATTPPGQATQQQQQAAAAALAAGLAGTPQLAGQPPVSEAVMAAAMAAGMTFYQHLQAAGAAGTPNQPSPFADINPLRAAAAAGPAASGSAAPSPGGSGVAALPQQLVQEMLARLNLGPDATPEQLEAAAAQLHQQALAKQQQQQQAAPSLQGSVGSAGSRGQQAAPAAGEAVRKSWRAFEDAPQYQQQSSGGAAAGSQENQQPRQQASASSSPSKPSRLGPSGAAPAASQAGTPQQQGPTPLKRLAPPPVEGLAGWSAMSREDVARCEAIFTKKGYPAVGGMERHSAMEYFAKLHMERPIFHQAWQAADLGGDGRLDQREFCLFVQLLRGAQKGWPLPARLSGAEAAALLGAGPMPAPPAGAQPPLHIDAARLRSALAGHGGHSRQDSFEQEQSVIQDDDDDASSLDSGISESVSGMSISSRPSYRPAHAAAAGPGASPYALGRPSAQPHARTGLGSVLGGGGAAAASATPGAYHPVAPGSVRLGAAPASVRDDDVAHRLLEVAVHSAGIRYRKPLSTPIFSLSVRDSLGRLVELPVDTHPGHYRRETATIHSSAIVRLATELRAVPPGSTLFIEIKHWKSDKRRFSTLAWAAAPLDRLVDMGQHSARVRGGTVDLPLLRKPVDLTLRKARRLSSRGADMHLSIRGVE